MPDETPAAEEPAAEEPASEEPAAETPAAEELAAEEPASEEPAAETPAAEELAAEEPASEEPAAEEPQEEESPAEETSPWTSLGAKTATLAGVAAFVAGGTGTVLAAISDFGADNGALDAARRNHVDALVIAACLAAFGLLLGALYTVLRSQEGHVGKKHRSRVRWAAVIVLGVGVGVVAGGVAVGAFATAKREPGRPFIQVERVDRSSLRVEISGDGLSTKDWFEAKVDGFDDDASTVVPLAAGRFSPGQDGNLDWKARFQMPPKFGGATITRLRVQVQKNHIAASSCDTDEDLTCLAIRVPKTRGSTVSSQAATSGG
jgi:hypothetical protein